MGPQSPPQMSRKLVLNFVQSTQTATVKSGGLCVYAILAPFPGEDCDDKGSRMEKAGRGDGSGMESGLRILIHF